MSKKKQVIPEKKESSEEESASEEEDDSEKESSEEKSSEEESASEEETLTKKFNKVKVSASKPGPKKGAKTAEEAPVKRPLTTYNHYVSFKIKELRLKHPGHVSTDYMKMAGAAWSKMSGSQKEAFAKKIASAA